MSVPETPVVTMIGGGQLARMTHQASIALGQTLRVLAHAADEPAAQVTPDVVFGSHTDLDDLRRAAKGATVLTFDHEQVPTAFLETLQGEGVNVQPPPSALIYAQDKTFMRRKLKSIGAPVPGFADIRTVADVERFAAETGSRVVLKAVRGGYDGRGVWITDDLDEARAVAAEQLAAGVDLLAEERVDMRRELSAMVARSPFGQGAAWPVVETVQRDGICAVVIAPAPELPEERAMEAEQLALRIATDLGVTGCLAVELFETNDGRLLVNELAMRPHNSGHWSMDGARTGQFEQHLRAVLDYPLGSTEPLAPVTVMANVLGAPETPAMSLDERMHHLMGRIPEAKVHLYGKGERAGRKLGHVNIQGRADGSPSDPQYVAEVRERAERAAHWLSHAVWTDGWQATH
ncbi:5-(carboxyamino)imidazole ribonucleotide synthase [Mycobacteroides chelonae]|nr:5-(carboxyamino)imidazole ribonucleotide synthase [Mycobacteroides chelonae]OLT80455.1 5-(carboxyamino)imidazole ribonucleotide synthase [Mycobacteroides chelonae]WED90877.1 5-(carboxyamino)imidazole ribonucleotide synthase [Mycobacteroides chelonae]WED95818.1 5-(carboxyamino)imidazole ribonucleotide synthase [Mycobacteroides chelonae]